LLFCRFEKIFDIFFIVDNASEASILPLSWADL
jgi:hypothetical protein